MPQGVKEAYATHLIDGLLQIQGESEVFVKNEHVPLIELALWVAEWLARDSSLLERVFSFFPDLFETELFQLAPLDGAHYQLVYFADKEREKASYLMADEAEFRLALPMGSSATYRLISRTVATAPCCPASWSLCTSGCGPTTCPSARSWRTPTTPTG
jgi:hypothetical protein